MGWLADAPALTTFGFPQPPVAARTGLALGLAAAALWLLPISAGPEKAWHRRGAQCLAGMVGLLGLLTLLEIFLGLQTGGFGRVLAGSIGQMAPLTAAGLLITSLALLLISDRKERRHNLSQLAAVPLFVLALLGLVGYAYGVTELYTAFHPLRMAFMTTVAFALLALGILFARPDRGPMELVSSETLAGEAARRLLPAAVLVPPILGFFRLLGQYRGWYSTTMGVLVLVVAHVVVFGALIFVTALPMAEEARKRSQSEARERRLAAIVESTDDAVVGKSVDGVVETWNAGAEKIFGYAASEIVRRSEARLVPPERVDEDRAMTERVTRGEQVRSYETERVCKDGRRIPVALTLSPIREADGAQIVGVAAIYRDITEQKRSEEEINFRRQLAETISENASSALLLLDAEGHLTYMNRAGEQMTGWRLDEARGRVAHDVFHWKHPDDRPFPIEDCPIVNAFRKLEPVTNHEDVFVRRDGTFFPVVCGIAPIERQGRVVGAVLEARDVTEQKRAEDEIRRFQAELEERIRERTRELAAVNEDLEAFSYSVSHDLRAPLRGIDFFSELLEKEYADRLDEDGRDYLRRVRSESRRLELLVSDILTLSKAARGDIHRETLDMSAMAREILHGFQAAEPDRNVDVEVQDHLIVDADPRLLRVVLDNLLGNAWKYTRRTPEAKIRVTAEETEGGPVLGVHDNGAGFDPSQGHRLFEPFHRLHGNEFPGTGIGLATVKRIVERHGGKTWAKGKPGAGASFYFTIPLMGERGAL